MTEYKNNSNVHLFRDGTLMVRIITPPKPYQSASGIWTKVDTESRAEKAYKASRGIVVEVKSKDRELLPELDSVILFRPYAGINIEGDDGEYYRILEASEINGVYLQTYIPQESSEFDNRSHEQILKEEFEKQKIASLGSSMMTKEEEKAIELLKKYK